MLFEIPQKWLFATVMILAAAACSPDETIFGGATSTRGTGGQAGHAGGGGRGGEGGVPAEVIDEWVATEPMADGTLALPPWLVLDSPSSSKTVQVASDTLRTGFGPNAPRARNVGSGWGLSVESERTNRVHHARISQPNWTLAMGTTLTAATGPDGVDAAATIADNSSMSAAAAYTPFTPDATGTLTTMSAWVGNITPNGNQAFIGSSRFTPQGIAIGPQVGWARYAYTDDENMTMTAFAQLYPAYGMPAPVATGSTSFDFVNVETGQYPSSAILTNGAPATRTIERLVAVNSNATFTPGGFFHVTIVLSPNYASGEQSKDHDLVFFGANDRVYLRKADRALVFATSGLADLFISSLDWKRDQELHVSASNSPSGRSLTISGDETGGGTTSDPMSAPIQIPTNVNLLGDTAGSQECADLRAISFYEPM